MRPPTQIWQCAQGHAICETCKTNPQLNNTCPNCRKKVTNRNNGMEKIALAYFGPVPEAKFVMFISDGSADKVYHHITDKIGDSWPVHLDKLAQLKQNDKNKSAVCFKDSTGIDVNLSSMFGNEGKRIYKNKQQMLNIRHIITMYDRTKQDPYTSFIPRTVMIGDRALRLRGISDVFSGQFKEQRSTSENWLAVAHNHEPDPRHGTCSNDDKAINGTALNFIKTTHCSMLGFVADEGKIYIAYWMMQNLMLDEGKLIQVESATLPIATAVKLQPQSVVFLNLIDPKAVLEMRLRHFARLSTGHMNAVNYNNKINKISVMGIRPVNTVSIIECDMSIDIHDPVGYVEPEYKAQATKPIEEVEENGTVEVFNKVGYIINNDPMVGNKLTKGLQRIIDLII